MTLVEGFHAPGDWLARKTNARQRRSFGFWSLLAAIIGGFFFGQDVLYVTVLSILALIPNISSETPVELEKELTDE